MFIAVQRASRCRQSVAEALNDAAQSHLLRPRPARHFDGQVQYAVAQANREPKLLEVAHLDAEQPQDEQRGKFTRSNGATNWPRGRLVHPELNLPFHIFFALLEAICSEDLSFELFLITLSITLSVRARSFRRFRFKIGSRS